MEQSEPWPDRASRPRRAAVSGFGFGGVNAHLLVEEYARAVRPKAIRTPETEPIAVVGLAAHVGPWSGEAFREYLS